MCVFKILFDLQLTTDMKRLIKKSIKKHSIDKINDNVLKSDTLPLCMLLLNKGTPLQKI